MPKWSVVFLVAAASSSATVARAQPAPDPGPAPEPAPLPPPPARPAPPPAPLPAPPARPAPPVPPAPPPIVAPPPDPVARCQEVRHAQAERAAATTDLKERGRLYATLPDCAHPTEVTVAASEHEMAAPPRPGVPRYHETGFALGLDFVLAPIPVNEGPLLDAPSTALFIGYQAGRVTAGATLSVDRSGRAGDQATSFDLLGLGASVRGTVARSETGASELLVVLDATHTSLSSSGSTDDSSGGLWTFRAGPSVRHWLTPQFAVAATAALHVLRVSATDGSDEGPGYLANLDYSIDLLGVF